MKNSLEKNILTKVGIIFIFSTVILSVLSGYLMFKYHEKVVEKQIIGENLLKAEKETVRFQNAVNQLNFLKNQIINELSSNEVKKDFNQYMEFKEDGSYRTFLDKSNNGKDAVGFIKKDAVMDSDFQRQFMITYDLIQTVGAINKENYFMTWAVFPNDSNVVFCPEKPSANYTIQADFSDTKENYWKLSTTAFNSNKEGLWLNPYYDPSFDVWMISYTVPVYFNNRHVMSLGFDIKIDDFFNRILKSQNKDETKMYYFVMNKEGTLIVHPKYMNKIKQANSNFSIFDLSTEEKDTYAKLLNKNYIVTPDYKYTRSNIGNTNWILVSAYNNLNYTYIIKHSLVILSFVSLFLVLILISSKIFLRKRLTDPLIQLAKSMLENKISQDYKSLETGDVLEVNQVIEAYNSLLAAYKEKSDYCQTYSNKLREELEIELQKSLAREKSIIMTDITKTVNTDIYQPLSVLKMNIDIINNKITQGSFKDVNNNIQTSLNIIKKISKIIFKLEIIEKSLNHEKRERINVGSIFQNLQKIYGSGFVEDTGIDIQWSCEDHKHIAVKEFSTLSSLMFVIDNAVESVAKKEKAWIKIEAKENGENFIFKITDSGKPLEPKVIQNIFSLNNVGGFSTKVGHRGFGLHACLKILKEAQGSVNYLENNGHPCFEVKYPVKKEELEKMVMKKRAS